MRGLLLLLLAAPVPKAPPLARAIDRILAAPAFEAAFWGVEIRDLSQGTVLYERNARKNFRPASTLKLVATAAALDLLGKDARERTTLETAAPLGADGVLGGDLFLVGGGDPALSEPVDPETAPPFEALADALRLAGVREVGGRLVGHEGLFTGPRRGAGWGWEDLVWWYGAEVSALSYGDNCARLTVSPGARPGEVVVLARSPETSYFRVENRATTSPRGTASDLAVERELGGNTITLSGTLPEGEGADLRVALEDPARFATTVFREVLERKGIRVGGIATSQDPLPGGRRVLAAHDGPPLSSEIRTINKRSQNLHAEMLLRLLGARAKGEGSVSNGIAAVQEFLSRQGVSAGEWDLEDASGLSAQDLVTPHGLVDLLAAMARHPEGEAFKGSLPVAGVDGSLRNRMKGTAAEGRVFAKTGSVSHVAGLAGNVDGKRGHLAIALLANHTTGKGREAQAAIDALCALLAGS